MSKKTRRRLDAGLEAKVALGGDQGRSDGGELESEFGVHPNQIYN